MFQRMQKRSNQQAKARPEAQAIKNAEEWANQEMYKCLHSHKLDD